MIPINDAQGITAVKDQRKTFLNQIRTKFWRHYKYVHTLWWSFLDFTNTSMIWTRAAGVKMPRDEKLTAYRPTISGPLSAWTVRSDVRTTTAYRIPTPHRKSVARSLLDVHPRPNGVRTSIVLNGIVTPWLEKVVERDERSRAQRSSWTIVTSCRDNFDLM